MLIFSVSHKKLVKGFHWALNLVPFLWSKKLIWSVFLGNRGLGQLHNSLDIWEHKRHPSQICTFSASKRTPNLIRFPLKPFSLYGKMAFQKPLFIGRWRNYYEELDSSSWASCTFSHFPSQRCQHQEIMTDWSQMHHITCPCFISYTNNKLLSQTWISVTKMTLSVHKERGCYICQ